MRRRATFPALTDTKHWRKVGREHGRREWPSEDGSTHPLGDDIRAAVTIEVLELRRSAGDVVAELTGRIRALEGEGEALDETAAMPAPRRRELTRRKEALAAEVERLVTERAVTAESTLHQIQVRVEIARRADATYREANGLARRIPVTIAEADLDLPPDLLAPLV